MEKEPTLFEAAINELVNIGHKHGFDQISFLRNERIANVITYHVLIDKKDTSPSNNKKNYPHIEVCFNKYEHFQYTDDILKLNNHSLSRINYPYFKNYIRSYMWHSFVFGDHKFGSKKFDPNIVKIGFLSVLYKSNHEILRNLETFKMRIKIHE